MVSDRGRDAPKDTGSKGPAVWTTGGPVAVDELGPTLVHEHVLIVPPGADWDPTSKFDRADVIVRAVDALARLDDFGIRTVVDPCPIDQGRDVEMLAEVASKSGVRIVCATGFYLEADFRGIPAYWRKRDVQEIFELFMSEIENGIGGTGIRPGVIKAATGLDVGEHERKVFGAAGRASRASGTTVVTHTEKSRHGDVQIELLKEAGADLGRCLIGHLDDLSENELVGLASAGSMLSVDRIGWDVLGEDSHRAELVVAMFRAGLSSQLCISQDRTATYWSPRPQFWVPEKSRDYVENVRAPALLRDGTTKGFTYLMTDFVPRLLDAGLTREDIDGLLVDNPRRLFGG